MFFNHNKGVSNKTFFENEKLKDLFHAVTYNYDKSGKMFISSIEAKNYPFFGT